MAGTFKPYNNNESDRISEELFDAFNVDDYDEREERAQPGVRAFCRKKNAFRQQ